MFYQQTALINKSAGKSHKVCLPAHLMQVSGVTGHAEQYPTMQHLGIPNMQPK